MADAVDQEAVRYFTEKKLRLSFSYKEVWGEEHAHAFTVAKSTGFDILGDVKGAVYDAIAKGETFDTFKSRLEPVLRAKGWWGRKTMFDPDTGEKVVAQLGSPRRLKVIYESNVRAARAAGLWERAQRTKVALPFFEYMLGPSEKHRPHHEDKRGLILPVDHPFWDKWFPPNGWGCKCWLNQITRSRAEARGGVSQAPEVETREFFNARKGTTEQIPVGIDPGWQTSPGKARARFLASRLGEGLAQLPVPDRNTALANVIQSSVFVDVALARVKGVMPVGVADQEQIARIGGTSRVVLLSSETAAKQLREHPDVSPADYGVVQQLLDAAQSFGTGDRHLLYLHEIEGQWWRAVIKATISGTETFIVSLHRKSAVDAERQRASLLRRQLRSGVRSGE